MIYWIALFAVEFILFYLYNKSHSIKRKQKILWCIIFCLVYFSGFRDGLGMDYTGYQQLCERQSFIDKALFLSEPLTLGLQAFCYNTFFSAVIYFVISSFLVCALSLITYSKFENFTLAAFVFVFFTDIYLSSMNIVSQFAAGGIILIGYYPYIKDNSKKNLYIAIGSVFLGMFIHLSSIFMLIPLAFKRSKNSSTDILIWILLIVASFFIPIDLLFKIPFVGNIIEYLDYTNYTSYNVSGISKLSTTNIYMHLLLIPFILKYNAIKKRKDADEYIYLIKMYAIYLIMYNFSTGNLTITYRLACFFVLFIPLLLAKLPNIVGKSVAYFLIVFPMLILLSFRLATGDRLTVPTRILPIESIVDQYYNPYQNPDADF
mgnify:CR=1 FL=1